MNNSFSLLKLCTFPASSSSEAISENLEMLEQDALVCLLPSEALREMQENSVCSFWSFGIFHL